MSHSSHMLRPAWIFSTLAVLLLAAVFMFSLGIGFTQSPAGPLPLVFATSVFMVPVT